MAEAGLRVTVAWIEGAIAVTREIALPQAVVPITYAELLALPQVLTLLPAWISGSYGLAVFGSKRAPGARVNDGDRIELLPPLRVDPKRARLRRAAKAAGTGQGPVNRPGKGL